LRVDAHRKGGRGGGGGFLFAVGGERGGRIEEQEKSKTIRKHAFGTSGGGRGKGKGSITF